jgi:hypothetical protein
MYAATVVYGHLGCQAGLSLMNDNIELGIGTAANSQLQVLHVNSIFFVKTEQLNSKGTSRVTERRKVQIHPDGHVRT